MIGFNEKDFVEELDEFRKEQFMQRLKQYDEQIAPTMRQHGFKRVDSSERTVLFTFGEVTFCRNRWRKGSETRYPVDEWLKLKPYIRYSPELIYHMAKLASKLSYREVCRTIQSTFRLIVTKDAVAKAVKIAGQLLSEKENYRFLLSEKSSAKLQSSRIYVEGDGVMVKTTSSADDRRNTDLAHFLVHTGTKKVGKGRYVLENKHEIIHSNHDKAKEELLDYLYNHFEITDKTVLVTNSDNGLGYSKRTFQEVKKALGIKHHEHFWDAYHVNEQIKSFLKPYPSILQNLAFKAIQTHKKPLLETVFDTVETLIETEEEYDKFNSFKQKLIRNFSDTKPAKLRGLSGQGIGVMESQHRKITYRMKHRGMYWSLKGVLTMSKIILLERIDQLDDLFFGDWRKQYQYYQAKRFSAGHLVNQHPHEAMIIKRRRRI